MEGKCENPPESTYVLNFMRNARVRELINTSRCNITKYDRPDDALHEMAIFLGYATLNSW